MFKGRIRSLIVLVALAQELLPLPLYSTTYTCTSASFGQFNDIPIPGGSSIWFTASLTPSGTPTSPQNLSVNWFMISFGQQANGLPYECHNYQPVSAIHFVTPPQEPVLTYFNSSNSWGESIPLQLSGSTFLTGCAVPPCSSKINSDCIPSGGLLGGLPVTWTMEFTTSPIRQPIVWQWGAAVYSQFPPCKEIGECQGFGPLGVKPVDDSNPSMFCVDSSSNCQTFTNSDNNGTPENYKQYLIAGGTGDGTNYTGTSTQTQVTCVLYLLH
jgi:hypothetical protein